eukprot:2798381-Karenia_brevis.AAC.1
MPQKNTVSAASSHRMPQGNTGMNGTSAVPVSFLVLQNKVRWGILAYDAPEKYSIRGLLA